MKYLSWHEKEGDGWRGKTQEVREGWHVCTITLEKAGGKIQCEKTVVEYIALNIVLQL